MLGRKNTWLAHEVLVELIEAAEGARTRGYRGMVAYTAWTDGESIVCVAAKPVERGQIEECVASSCKTAGQPPKAKCHASIPLSMVLSEWGMGAVWAAIDEDLRGR